LVILRPATLTKVMSSLFTFIYSALIYAASMPRTMQTARRSNIDYTPPTDSVSVADSHDATRSFALVSHNLAQIGSIPLERFLTDNTPDLDRVDLAAFQIHTRIPTPPLPARPRPIQPSDAVKHITTETADTANNVQMNPVSRLQKACQCTFGNTDALTFEFLEENGAQSGSTLFPIGWECDQISSKPNSASLQSLAPMIHPGPIPQLPLFYARSMQKFLLHQLLSKWMLLNSL
jgi:hypothetical protein